MLGVSHAAGLYNFTSADYLNEGADRVLELGSRVIKVFLVPDRIQDLYLQLGLVPPAGEPGRAGPEALCPFAKPFSTFILETTPVSGVPQFLDGLTAGEAAG